MPAAAAGGATPRLFLGGGKGLQVLMIRVVLMIHVMHVIHVPGGGKGLQVNALDALFTVASVCRCRFLPHETPATLGCCNCKNRFLTWTGAPFHGSCLQS
jgi:hypothetical protein